MKKNTPRLVELLSSLSQKEWKSLHRYVRSPYFNTDKTLVKLLDMLERDVIGKRAYNESAQWRVYRKIFDRTPAGADELSPKEKKLLGASMSKLTQLVKHFITVEMLDKNDAYSTHLLLEGLLEKKQVALFQSVVQKEKKDLVQQTGDYLRKYLLEESIFHYFEQHTEQVEKADNFAELTENFDKYYLYNKLNYHLSALMMTDHTAQKNYNFASFDALQPLLALPQHAEDALIILYQTAILMVGEKDALAYDRLLKLLDQQGDIMTQTEMTDFYTTATNFCIHQIIRGKLLYNRRLFELFRIMENKDLLRVGGLIPAGKMKNIVSISCHIGEFDWAKWMVEKYRPFIEKSIRESVYYFNLGTIAFYQKDYLLAQSHFAKVLQGEKVNTAYYIGSRMMLLKSDYEINDTNVEPTLQKFRSAERFIIENKLLTATMRKGYKNFIQVLGNLYSVRHRVGKMTLDGIQKKLDAFEVVSDKRWLLEKMEELK